MPHLVLEYSDNLVEPLDVGTLFAKLHAELEGFGLFRPEDIKSRAVAHAHYRVGKGDPGDVFVHVTLSIMAGRPAEVRKALGAAIAAGVRGALGRTWQERRCDVTVDVREMDRETYAKQVSRG